MRRLAPPHHGTVLAVGFVIDHALVGEAEARQRVLERWRPGSSLRDLDDQRWIFLLAGTEEVHCQAAPGLPIEAYDLSQGRLQLWDRGLLEVIEFASLPSVDPGRWLSTEHLRLTALEPCEAPPPSATAVERLTPAKEVNLRDRAAVRERSAKSESAIREMTEDGWRRGKGAGRGGTAPDRAPRDRLARLLMRSPVAGQISRRHAKYLQELTRAFERRDYESALRDAIGLGGNSTYLSLRLPSPRARTSGASPELRGGGAAIPLGTTAQNHLSQLYRQAATELERQGRVSEAAFVLADLLNSATEAVALLERHGELALAAELAEGRQLDPADVVRLWWRAGQRDRAIGIARARGAHAAAVERLEKVDHESAVALRDHWAQSLALTGDLLGAVQVTWQTEELRSRTQDHLALGMALGGETAARLFAYQLALAGSNASLEAALQLLTTEDSELLGARDAFLSTYAELPAAGSTADRHLATMALRLLAGARSPRHWSSAQRRTAHNALRERADPVLREDLPSGFTPGTDLPPQKRQLLLGGPPGQIEISDAVPMAGGSTLVACGSHGLRLLTRSGATRGHWDVPAHQIVAAHHGGSAVVATGLGANGWELHRFNLVTQQLDRWIVIRAARLVTEFDGTVFTFIDEAGTLIFLDVEAERARVVWTEVDDGEALDVTYTATSVSALVRHALPGQDLRFEAWRWDLPQRTLRQRQVLDVTDVIAGSVLPDGQFVALVRNDDGVVLRVGGLDQEIAAADGLRTSGGSYALLRDGAMDLVTPTFEAQVISETGEGLRFRHNQESVTVWDDAGHLAVLDGRAGQTLLHTQIRV